MKKLNHALLTCVAAAVLAACTTPPAPTSVIEYNYTIDNAKANGIVQVFDLSGNTVIQIRDLNATATHFYDAKNAPIPFTVMGENVVLAGLHLSFTVSTATAASRIVRKNSAAMPGVARHAAGANAAGPSGQDEAISAEIGRIRKEIAELKLLLASANARPAPLEVAAGEGEDRETPVDPSVVIVSFANNSRQFAPAAEQKSQLAALGQTARNISIRGYTDSEVATTGSTALAKARAEAAKRYLIAMGVTPKRIRVSYEAAGNFIVDNRSAAGRAANRRVEIGGS